MITVLLLLLIVGLVGFEYLFFKQKSLYKNNSGILKSLTDNIEILKALSYLPNSKLNDLTKIMDECAAALFKKEYDLFKLVIEEHESGPQVLGYLKSGSRIMDNQLNEVEKKFLLNLRSGTNLKADSNGFFHQDDLLSIPLTYFDSKLGYLILKSRVTMDKEEADFLNVIASGIILILRRVDFDKNLSLADQLKAMNVKW